MPYHNSLYKLQSFLSTLRGAIQSQPPPPPPFTQKCPMLAESRVVNQKGEKIVFLRKKVGVGRENDDHIRC